MENLQKPNDPTWCNGWPMTMRRIRHFQKKWEGVPGREIPFALHACNYLMAIIDGNVTPGDNDDPKDAPWMDSPESYSEWYQKFKASFDRMPTPSEYTEADRKLHDVIEKTGPKQPAQPTEEPYLGYAPADKKEEPVDPLAGMF